MRSISSRRFGPGIGHERVPGMPQVVKVDRWQAGGGQRGEPDAAAEVAVPQRQAGRTGEDERVVSLTGTAVEMGADAGRDQAGNRHQALARV